MYGENPSLLPVFSVSHLDNSSFAAFCYSFVRETEAFLPPASIAATQNNIVIKQSKNIFVVVSVLFSADYCVESDFYKAQTMMRSVCIILSICYSGMLIIHMYPGVFVW